MALSAIETYSLESGLQSAAYRPTKMSQPVLNKAVATIDLFY